MNLNRRTFLTTTAASTLLGSKIGASVDKGEKSVIWIWLGGGASSTEFTNPIPDTTSEFRGINGAINTQGGYLIGADFPNLAKISDKYTTVRSFGHKDANHSSATHVLNTSHYNFTGGEGSPQKEPCYGSIASKFYGENTNIGVPNFVKLQPIQYDGAAWLGSKYTGFDNDENGIKSLKLNIPKEQFERRMSIIRSLEKSGSEKENLYKQWSDLRETANQIIAGKAGDAFNLLLSNDADRLKYNVDKSGLGKSFLLAKRLIEANSKFIQLTYGGWDLHSNIADGTKTLSRELDLYLTSFLTDLAESGRLENTLVVVATEFGRTFKLNVTSGRDHNPVITPLILAGGNYMGGLIGTTDKINSEITSNKYTNEDLAYTILNHLNIPKDYTVIDSQSRPRHIISNDAKIIR